jgi:hypothetical protein
MFGERVPDFIGTSVPPRYSASIRKPAASFIYSSASVLRLAPGGSTKPFTAKGSAELILAAAVEVDAVSLFAGSVVAFLALGAVA